MGNQREIQQVAPYRCLGAVLNVRDGSLDRLNEYLKTLPDPMYTHVREPQAGIVELGNLDFGDSVVPHVHGTVATISSGGKMWCGYDEFIAHVSQLAAFVEDAIFYIADEEDYIDQFVISGGALEYTRVYEGAAWNLDAFIVEEALDANGQPRRDIEPVRMR